MQELHEIACDRPGLQLSTHRIELVSDDGIPVVIEGVLSVNEVYLRILSPVDAVIKCQRAKAVSKSRFTIWPTKETKVQRV